MSETRKPRSTRSVAVLALAVLAMSSSSLMADPQGRRGGPPGAGTENPTLVPFVDPATLVRTMTRQQVVMPNGTKEQKVVAPAAFCAGLSPNASKTVALPDVRWGLRTATAVAATRRTTATLSWPGQRPRDEVLPDGMPGSSERQFTLTRPGPRSVRVTLLAVGGGGTQATLGDGSVRTIRDSIDTGGTLGGVRDGTSNTIAIGETGRLGQTVCVSDVFVQDPQIEVRVNVAGPPGQGPAERRSTF